tara:strand:+ start:724 stop:1233 length:510 start_codon:yes stop_codon:yes gene_type:complete
MTSIGTSNIHVNDVGNPYLHSKHRVGIVKFKNGNIGRAIVFDQHLIDILYNEKHLNERQHNVCNKYLSVIMKGMHLSSPSLEERISTGKYNITPIPRSCILIKVQRHLKETCGREVESRFWVLMSGSARKIEDQDVQLMKVCAESLLGFYCISQESPVALFQRALLNPI